MNASSPNVTPPPPPLRPQVYWTREVTEAITTGGSRGLAAYADRCTLELNKIVNLVRGQVRGGGGGVGGSASRGVGRGLRMLAQTKPN